MPDPFPAHFTKKKRKCVGVMAHSTLHTCLETPNLPASRRVAVAGTLVDPRAAVCVLAAARAAEPAARRVHAVRRTHSDIRTGDRACSIDGLSLKRLYAAEPPSVPPEVKIDVAEGARLDLDYDGTVRVRGLSLAGRGQVGVIDATTCPGYVTGRGKLDVRPNGTIVLFR